MRRKRKIMFSISRINQRPYSVELQQSMIHLTLVGDYFPSDALFTNNFCQRFQMRKNVLDRLYKGFRFYDDYFILKKDVVGEIGFSDYQKCSVALRILEYSTSVDL